MISSVEKKTVQKEEKKWGRRYREKKRKKGKAKKQRKEKIQRVRQRASAENTKEEEEGAGKERRRRRGRRSEEGEQRKKVVFSFSLFNQLFIQAGRNQYISQNCLELARMAKIRRNWSKFFSRWNKWVYCTGLHTGTRFSGHSGRNRMTFTIMILSPSHLYFEKKSKPTHLS